MNIYTAESVYDLKCTQADMYEKGLCRVAASRQKITLGRFTGI